MKMNRLLPLILILVLLLCGCGDKQAAPAETAAPTSTAEPSPTPEPSPTAEPTPEPTPSPEPTPAATSKPLSPEVEALLGQNGDVWREKHDRVWMAGRLFIPSAGINVPLYVWNDAAASAVSDPDRIIEVVRQQVVDETNSALIYHDGLGNVIADHSNQDFSALSSVKEGDAAYILAGDCVISLRCDLVVDGVNTGNGITDAEGNWFTANEDYICYTCMETGPTFWWLVSVRRMWISLSRRNWTGKRPSIPMTLVSDSSPWAARSMCLPMRAPPSPAVPRRGSTQAWSMRRSTCPPRPLPPPKPQPPLSLQPPL